MTFKGGGVAVTEKCSCGAEVSIVSATGWLDSGNVIDQLRKWREGHVHDGPREVEEGENHNEH